MGYSTRFKGHFLIEPDPTITIVSKLQKLHHIDGRDFEGMPNSFNQWELEEDLRHIKWNGGEKFYHYIAWLNYILKEIILNHGLTLTGKVKYSGEDVEDNGIIIIKDNIVTKIEN